MGQHSPHMRLSSSSGWSTHSRPRARVPLLALVGALASGCTSTPQADAPKAYRGDVAPLFVKAFDAEMTDPLADGLYLDSVDKAVADPDNPASLPVVIASIHALVTQLDIDPPRVSMPISFRSREGMERTVLRLRQAWDALDNTKAEHTALLRAHIARGLHALALYSGLSLIHISEPTRPY